MNDIIKKYQEKYQNANKSNLVNMPEVRLLEEIIKDLKHIDHQQDMFEHKQRILEESWYVLQAGSDCDGGQAFGMSIHATYNTAEEEAKRQSSYSDGMTYHVSNYLQAKEYCMSWQRVLRIELERELKNMANEE